LSIRFAEGNVHEHVSQDPRRDGQQQRLESRPMTAPAAASRFVARLLLPAALLLLALPVWAQSLVACTDKNGNSYRVSRDAVARLTAFRCAAVAEAGAADTRPPHDETDDIASALGLKSPAAAAAVAPAMRDGGMRVVAVVGAGLRTVSVGSVAAGAVSSDLFDALIASAAKAHGQDVSLLRAIIHVESGFNPSAVSPKGAIGLMQLMPATARRIGVDTSQRALFDPATNINAGARYLRMLMDMFSGRPELAIAAYNAGESAVLRYRRQIPPYPETQGYVKKVLAQYSQYKAE
jgi:soluble lytic murein transglycosylase-like protein